MVTRLSASDASFYHLEDTSTPMYVGTLSTLRKPRNGLSYETLLATVEQRLPQIPRYRQKVREVTLGLARPMWVDDRDFDITYHIRRSALPSPGSDAQLHELIARLGSRPLDKSRAPAPPRGRTAPAPPTRRFPVAGHRLDDYRLVRARYDCDVNDVLLAVVAGALRNWLMSRGEPVTATTTVRAMAPMSVYPDADLDTTGPGQAISERSPFLVDLPVGEGNAVVRLSHIAPATESHPTAASLVDARTIVTLSGFAPPTLHAM